MDNNNNNNNFFANQNFTKSNAPNNSVAGSYQNNENNFNLFNQFQPNSVVDVLKHLSLDQDDFNMFQSPLVSNTLVNNNNINGGFSNTLNGDLGIVLILILFKFISQAIDF